jgi:hypothetical protein
LETAHTIDAPEGDAGNCYKLTTEECLNNGIDDGSFSIGIINYAGAYGCKFF